MSQKQSITAVLLCQQLDRHLAECEVRPSTMATYRRVARQVLACTGPEYSVDLALLASDPVYHRAIQSDISRRILESAYAAATKQGIRTMLQAAVPGLKLKLRLPTRPTPKRTLTAEEISAIRALDLPPVRRIALEILLSGLRQGEAIALHWSDYNPALGRLRIAPAKTADGRTIPVTSHLERALAAIPPADRFGRILGLSRSGLDKATRSMTAAIGLTHSKAIMGRTTKRTIGPHALRHTTGTLLLRAGVPIRMIADILGHASTLTTERYYLHPDHNDLAEALARAI